MAPRLRWIGLLCAVGFLVASPSTAHAVNCAGLQAALNAAPLGSTVTVDEGVTCTNMSFDLPARQITLVGAGSGATFNGDAGAGDRILDGANIGRTIIRNLTFRGGSAPAGTSGGAMNITGTSTPTLDDVEFYGNSASNLAGAVRIQPTSGGADPVVVTNSTFGSTEPGGANVGAVGGGLYINAANRPVQVTNSRFIGNVSDAVGGGVSVDGSAVTFGSNVVSSNTARFSGGGLNFTSSTMSMTDNTFIENKVDDPAGTVDQRGGAVASFTSGTLEQSGNVFHRNSIVGADASTRERTGGAQWWQGPNVVSRGDRYTSNSIENPAAGGESEGGALSIDGCGAAPDDVRLENVVITGNKIFGPGGGGREGAGIYTGCALGPVGLTLSNATVTANDAGGAGTAGVYGAPMDSLVLNNSIVAGNLGGIDLQGFGSSSVSNSDACLAAAAVPPGPNNFCANPLLVSPQTGDVHQTATSPTRDAGSNALVPAGLTTDFEGETRAQGPAVDIGADEVPVPATPPTQQPPLTPAPPLGSPPLGSTPIAAPRDLLAPLVTGARLTRTSFRRATAATPLTSQRRRRTIPRGTTIRFSLSETATVSMRIDRRLSGRRVGSRCVRQTRSNRGRRACTRLQSCGTLTRRSRAGLNRYAFSGRIGRRALAPGRHQITITARDAAGNVSRPRTLRFTVVRG